VLRISKLTDYGIVLLARFAVAPPGATLTAREMAEGTGLPHPVVSKMLKTLAGASLLRSQRGAKGGYQLSREPEALSVAQILEALEGPLALMECSAGPGHCERDSSCTVRAPWQHINRAVRGALDGMTLAELAGPREPLVPIQPAADTPRVAK
jgi:FeS assembly SUF system regulator